MDASRHSSSRMGPASPILHIGYHKTATSWFQRELYPRARGARALAPDEIFERILRPRALEFDAGAAREGVAGEPGVRPILCSEELSGNIHNGGLHGCLSKEVGLRLREAFPDGEVVVFLRSQVTMIPSVYVQYVRMGGTHGVGRYLRPGEARPNRAPLFALGHLDYDRLLEHYEALFGPERLHVYLYEDLREDAAGFLKRFTRDLDLDVDLERVGQRRRNVSYQRRTVALARLLNRFSAERVLYKHYVVHVPGFFRRAHRWLRRLDRSRWMGGPVEPEALLGGEALAGIRRRYARGNAEVAERYGLDLRRHGYPLPE